MNQCQVGVGGGWVGEGWGGLGGGGGGTPVY